MERRRDTNQQTPFQLSWSQGSPVQMYVSIIEQRRHIRGDPQMANRNSMGSHQPEKQRREHNRVQPNNRGVPIRQRVLHLEEPRRTDVAQYESEP